MDTILLFVILIILLIITNQLNKILKKENRIMADLDMVKADMDALKDGVGKIIANEADLKAKLAAALAGVLSPEQQAKIDAIYTEAEEVKTAILADLPAA